MDSGNEESINPNVGLDSRLRVGWWSQQINLAMSDFMALPTDQRLSRVSDMLLQYQNASKAGELKLPGMVLDLGVAQ